MRQQLFFRGGTSGTTTLFADIISGTAVGTTNQAWTIMPFDGNFRQLRIELEAAPGAGTSITFEVWISGASSGLSVTISDTDVDGINVSDIAPFSDQEDVVIRITSTSSGNITFKGYMTQTADTPNYSIVSAASGGNFTTTANAVEYLAPGCGLHNMPIATLNQSEIPWPAAGTLRDPHFEVNVAPGGGRTRIMSIFKNGADTFVLAQISDSATSASSSGSVAVARGDLISFRMLNGAVSPAAARGTMSCVFEPTTPNLFVVPTLPTNTLGNTSRFSAGYNNFTNWETTGNTRKIGRGGMSFEQMNVRLTVAPGGATNRRFLLIVGGVFSAMDLTITGAATTGNDAASVLVDELDFIVTRASRSGGTPAATHAAVAYAAKMADIVSNPFIRAGL